MIYFASLPSSRYFVGNGKPYACSFGVVYTRK